MAIKIFLLVYHIKELKKLKSKQIKIFVGHCFYGEKRVEKYRKLYNKIFNKEKYKIIFGTQDSFQDYRDFFKEIRRLIRSSKYCIFDLKGYNKEKLPLNLNVLLETGISIGMGKKWYVMAPFKGICNKLVKEISNISGSNIRFYKIIKIIKELKGIKRNIDDWEKAKKYRKRKKLKNRK